MTDFLVSEWVGRRATIIGRLAATDERMRRMFAKSRESEPPAYVFRPGDLVWLKQRRSGKLFSRATGPHVFVEYRGDH